MRAIVEAWSARLLAMLLVPGAMGFAGSVGCSGRLGVGIQPATDRLDAATVTDAPTDDMDGTPRDTAGSDVAVDGADGPVDLARDLAVDVLAGDMAVTSDGGRDASAAVDALGPFVCGRDTDCKLPGLHCLVVPGQPGRCVECVGDGHCSGKVGTPICDTLLSRCVECVVGLDCPSPSSTYPSTCTTVSRRCQTGCDDSSTACPTTRNYACVDDLYLCVECRTNAQCAGSPHGAICHPSEFVCVECLATSCGVGLICDPVTARCVQCRTSRDCPNPAAPLCDPATLTCVPVPP